MRAKIVSCLMPLLIAGGCTESRVDPCGLLTLAEVSRLAPEAMENEWASPGKDNELCLWHDDGDMNVFMLFYYPSRSADPVELVKSGMSGLDARFVTVTDVGRDAVAGFARVDSGADSETMGLFAASSGKGTIGVRVQGITSEKGENFRVLKEIAGSALSRL